MASSFLAIGALTSYLYMRLVQKVKERFAQDVAADGAEPGFSGVLDGAASVEGV